MSVLASPSLASDVREIGACRSCGSSALTEVLDLGVHYVSTFVDAEEGHRAPLILVRCETCTLVQLRHTVPSAWHYEHGYWYRSGTNEQMVRQLQNIVDDIQRAIWLESGDVVVDIGCNDGTMLRMFPEDVVRIGFEPAANLRESAEVGGNIVVTDFWPQGIAQVSHHEKARVIAAVAMFYDLDDPHRFLDAVRGSLADDGVFVIQMAYAPAMLQTNDVGNVSHEHLCYYTVESLAHLMNRHGLMIEDVSFNDVNGGSFRIFVRHGTGGIDRDPPGTLLDWQGFAERVRMNKQATVGHLRTLRARGLCVAGYGASTRGNTVLQYYGIGPDLLPYIAERDPRKWGKRTVGTWIPIINEEEMRAKRPDYLFVLPFHLIESFKAREPDYVGRFIVPLPTLRVE